MTTGALSRSRPATGPITSAASASSRAASRRSGEFPDDHYRRLAYLVAYLIQNTSTPLRYAQVKGEDGIIDHRTITPHRRVDPGDNFKRQLLLDLVQRYLDGTEPSPWANGDGITW